MRPQLMLLLLPAIASGIAFLEHFPVRANNTRFICGKSGGVPATLAQTPRGNVPVIRWVSEHFSDTGYDPQTRCQQVSARFQTYQNQGALKYMTTGVKNGLPIVCVAQHQNGPCKNDREGGQLFTLRPGRNPDRTLQELMNVRVRAGGPLNESSASSRIYVDMQEFLNTTPTEAIPPEISIPAESASRNVLW